ncbi:hypothetical protein CVT24_011382 [Panaeolus cyanescens]|uniref:IRG-type G domain-containing protein n=1 Tax=Panaeolus cyanescens TaxID=181874 RepID=A0A409VG14_9AGAR|nr:hypothetical protein CVT24_011382 [Panaeolus cyanescens]
MNFFAILEKCVDFVSANVSPAAYPVVSAGLMFAKVLLHSLAEEVEKEEKAATEQAQQTKERAEQQAAEAEAAERRLAETRRQAEEARRRAEEVRRREQDDIARRTEEDRRASEQAIVRATEARRRAEEAERRAKEQVEEAKKRAEEAMRQAQEAMARAEEVKKKAEDTARRAEEAREEAEARLMRGIPPEFQPSEEDKRKFQQQYGIESNRINIAIVGECGVGKSSLLNSIRGLSPGDPGAAPAGFDETTEDVESYPDPRNPIIVWYDLPGANTPRVRGWTYFVEQGLYVFDILLVVFSGRFTETAGTLISNANKCSIPAFLVRTKADQLIQSAQEDAFEPLSNGAARELVVANTRRSVATNLVRMQLPAQKVYIVSRAGMKELVLTRNEANVIDEMKLLNDIVRPLEALISRPRA